MTYRDVLATSYLGTLLALGSVAVLAAIAYIAYQGTTRLQQTVQDRNRQRQEFTAAACEPYDSAAGVAAVHAAGALSKACCERWWTSTGTDHDPTCPSPRSHA